MQDIWVLFLGWEDPLKKEIAAHSSILAWKIPWTEEPGRLWSIGSQRVKRDSEVTTHTKRWFNICKSLSEIHHITIKGKKKSFLQWVITEN